MAATATTSMALTPCSTGFCSQTGPVGDSSSAPDGSGDCYHSGRVSLCSTASGSTDQLCSVLVSQQLPAMGQEGHLKGLSSPHSLQPGLTDPQQQLSQQQQQQVQVQQQGPWTQPQLALPHQQQYQQPHQAVPYQQQPQPQLVATTQQQQQQQQNQDIAQEQQQAATYQQHKMQAVRPGPLQHPDDCISPASHSGSATSSFPANTPTPSSDATASSGRHSAAPSSSTSTAAGAAPGGSAPGLGDNANRDLASSSSGGIPAHSECTRSSSSSNLALPPGTVGGTAVSQGPGPGPVRTPAGSFSSTATGSFTSPVASLQQMLAPMQGLVAPGVPPMGLAVTAALGQVAPGVPPSHGQGAGPVPADAGAAAALMSQHLGGPGMSQHPGSGYSSGSSPVALGGGGMMPGGAFSMGRGLDQSPPLVQQLGVSIDSLARLFRADADTEFEQPVWMVINLQGKIKGSYTADKMIEFCRRGTLGGAQLVLGLDRNLPYNARQELSYYRPLSHLVIAVHHGARYCPLTEAAVTQLARQGLAAAQWEPLVSPAAPEAPATSTATPSDSTTAVGELAADLQQGLDLSTSSPGSGQGPLAASSSRVAAMAAAARLRSVLQRLCCGSGSRMQGGGRPMGRRQTPLWMYINHLGWCRGPFSGGKVIQAHMCGRLPHDTLVVGLEPDVPPALISTDVEFWFRPMKDLIEQVAAGYSYNPVSWQDVAAYSLNQQSGQGSAPQWQPLVYRDIGNPPPFQGGPQPSISNQAAAASNLMAGAHLMAAQHQHPHQQHSPDAEAAAAAVAAMHAAAAAAAAAGGVGSPQGDTSRTGSFSGVLQGDAAAAAAAAAGGSMMMGMSAGMPAGSSGVQSGAAHSDAAGGPGASPVSQGLLMHLLQPQQWPQGDANAGAQLQAQYAMPTYPVYLMQQPAGFAVPGMHVGMGHNAAGTVPGGTWDPHQLAAAQQALLQSSMMGHMGMAGGMMHMPQNTAAAGAGMGAGYSPAGFQASAAPGFGMQGQQQQFWGQQGVSDQGWGGGGNAGGHVMGGAGGGAQGQQGVLPGVMTGMQFLPGSQQMQ